VLRRSLLSLAALVLAIVVASAGCGTEEQQQEQQQPAASPPKDFPVTLTAANGKVTIPERPDRIISLSPTSTESLFAIGAGRQVVAVDDQSDYPPTAPKTKLSGYTPNAEAIAGYRPDLVVLSGNENNIIGALGKLGIPVLLHPAADDLEGAYRQIEQLGFATGHRREAGGLVTRLKTRIGALVKSTRVSPRPLFVYHELSPDGYSATSKTFIGRVYGLFGLRNVADKADSAGSGYPQLSAEYLVAADPDLIVLADTVCCEQTADSVAARPGWDGIAAVRNGAVVEVDDSLASRWGPRIVEFVRAVALALERTR
jgi:iron complex transport system substrate-binding protein